MVYFLVFGIVIVPIFILQLIKTFVEEYKTGHLQGWRRALVLSLVVALLGLLQSSIPFVVYWLEQKEESVSEMDDTGVEVVKKFEEKKNLDLESASKAKSTSKAESASKLITVELTYRGNLTGGDVCVQAYQDGVVEVFVHSQGSGDDNYAVDSLISRESSIEIRVIF